MVRPALLHALNVIQRSTGFTRSMQDYAAIAIIAITPDIATDTGRQVGVYYSCVRD